MIVGRGASLGIAAALAGCGGAAQHQLPPAAEPAASPAPTRQPAGRVIAVGNLPEGVVVDPATGLAVVALHEPNELAFLDASTGRVVRRVPLRGAPRHLALEAAGGPVLVPAERIDALLRVRLTDGAVTSIPVGRFPHDAAASGGRVLVGDERGGSLTILAGRRTVATLSRGRQPGGVAALAGGRAAVIDVRTRVLSLYRLDPPGLVAEVAAGVGPTHVVGAGGRLYVADTQGQGVLELRVGPGLLITGRVAAEGSPYGIALDAVRRRLWVTLTARNQLVKYRLGGPAPVESARYATVRQPDTVAVDPRNGRVFVAGRDPGLLQLIDPR